ncbi:ubiquitin carboxyl-terminal hydrolase 47-like [Artemia franciscana]|uniref:ubiquitin carboxyl-terminal hydrolase 47-like n=1 Tax=Artemia franciscana TaxID=6661 RepID=UPI0032DAD1A0
MTTGGHNYNDSIPSLSKYHASASASNLDYNSGVLPCASPQDYLVTEGPPLTRWQPREGELTSDEEVGNISLGSMSPQPASPLNAEDYDLIDVDQDVSSDRRFETGEHSASEDSSLTDSDRTLMGDPPEDGIVRPPSPQMSSASSSHFKIDQAGASRSEVFLSQNQVPKFFRLEEIKKEKGNTEYKLAVDRRMHLGEMKKNLEPYVNVPCDFFRIFKIQASCGIDRECVNLNESLETFGDEAYLTVRLGRALKPGEIRGKVFHLQPNEAEAQQMKRLFATALGAIAGTTASYDSGRPILLSCSIFVTSRPGTLF